MLAVPALQLFFKVLGAGAYRDRAVPSPPVKPRGKIGDNLREKGQRGNASDNGGFNGLHAEVAVARGDRFRQRR